MSAIETRENCGHPDSTDGPDDDEPIVPRKKNNKGRSARRRQAKTRSVQEAVQTLLQSPHFVDDTADIDNNKTAPNLSPGNKGCWDTDRQWSLSSVLIRRREFFSKHDMLTPSSELEEHKEYQTESPDTFIGGSGSTMMLQRTQQEEDPNHFYMPLADVRNVTSQLGFFPGNAIAVVSRVYDLVQSNLYPNLTRVLCRYQQEHCSVYCNNKNDDEDAGIMNTPLVLMLYPLALREEHSGGKAKGQKFKSRKRSSTLSSHIVDIHPSHSQSAMVVEPFPTLYWLTHPLLKVLISQLEVDGHSASNIHTLKQRLHSNPLYLEEMKQCHLSYGQERTNLITSQDWETIIIPRRWDAALGPSRGVAGLSNPAAVKCLHTHSAQYLAALQSGLQLPQKEPFQDDMTASFNTNKAQNLVGLWTLQALEEMVQNKEYEF